MPASSDLVARSADLKRALLQFAHGPRLNRALRQALQKRFGQTVVADQSELALFFDHFLLQHRLGDGRTVVEHFVRAHPELPEEERALLLGWRDVVEGLFEVKGQEGEALVALNLVDLVDELTYRLRSNVGPGVFARMPVGSYLIARVVPVGEEWLLSGAQAALGASQRAEVQRLAADLARQHPALVFRNPAKLAQG